MSDLSGPISVMQARAMTVATARARLFGELIVLREAVGYEAARVALEAEWTRLVADDPNRASREGFVS